MNKGEVVLKKLGDIKLLKRVKDSDRCRGALGPPWMSESLTVKGALRRRVPSARPKPGAMLKTLQYPCGPATDQWDPDAWHRSWDACILANPGLSLPRLCHPLDIFLRGDI